MATRTKAAVHEGVELLDRRPPPEGRVTFDEFVEWAGEDDKAEWVDGEVVLLMPESRPHQRLVIFLVTLFQVFAATHDLGEVMATFLMRLVTRPSGRAPDVLFLAREHLGRLKETYVDGPADLVVEIVSPTSLERDREEKFAEYAGASIPEYWLIDPAVREAAFYQLGSDGSYQRVWPDETGVYRSKALPGFWLRVDWLWRDPPPQIQAMQALGLLPSAAQ
jgi:Uma2 family endonuclease